MTAPEDGAALRARYEAAVLALGAEVDGLRRSGASEEWIARHVHARRRTLAAVFKARTPEPMRGLIEARTRRVHGDAEGPSIVRLRAAGRTWGEIIESACRPGRLQFDPERGPVPLDDPDAPR